MTRVNNYYYVWCDPLTNEWWHFIRQGNTYSIYVENIGIICKNLSLTNVKSQIESRLYIWKTQVDAFCEVAVSVLQKYDPMVSEFEVRRISVSKAIRIVDILLDHNIRVPRFSDVGYDWVVSELFPRIVKQAWYSNIN